MSLDLEQLLHQVRAYAMIIVSPTDVWPSPWATSEIKTALVEHRNEVKRLLELGASELCPNPALHAHSWRYIGRGRYICGLCERLNKEALD